jgi:photosystem II stability/assembly factor-like uncharacterized protein
MNEMYKLNCTTFKQRKVHTMKTIKFIPILTLLILLFTGCPTQPDKTPSWNLCCTLPDSGVYKDIFFIDAGEGWLVEESDKIFHTSNGGGSWELQNSGNHDLVTVHFLDKQYGWATGLRAAYYTIDGGTSWNYVDLVGYGRITMPITEKIFFIDIENILMFFCDQGGSDFGVSRYTFDVDNAVFSWLASASFPHRPSTITNVQDKVWFADVKQNIYLSTDGGETWSTGQVEADSGEISAINDIHFTDEQNGWFCSNASVYYSEDGGKNWHCKATLPDSSLSRICFFSDEGWVMGERIIYYSSDGGESWQDQYQVDGEEKLVSISFVNHSSGWALSESGNVYRYGID